VVFHEFSFVVCKFIQSSPKNGSTVRLLLWFQRMLGCMRCQSLYIKRSWQKRRLIGFYRDFNWHCLTLIIMPEQRKLRLVCLVLNLLHENTCADTWCWTASFRSIPFKFNPIFASTLDGRWCKVKSNVLFLGPVNTWKKRHDIMLRLGSWSN
jgi:hypothetical protein